VFDNTFNGLDFGFADDPTAFIRLHLDNKRKTIYIFDEFALRGLFIDDIAEELQERIASEYITWDSAEPRSVQDLKRNGIKALPAKKGPGSSEHGINSLQGHKIVVDESCTETIKELAKYKYKVDKDGNVIAKPVDANNHLLDALRYARESEMIQNKPTVKLFKHGF